MDEGIEAALDAALADVGGLSGLPAHLIAAERAEADRDRLLTAIRRALAPWDGWSERESPMDVLRSVLREIEEGA